MRFCLSPCDLLRLRECPPHAAALDEGWGRVPCPWAQPTGGGAGADERQQSLERRVSGGASRGLVVARHLLCQENLSQALLDVANLRSGSTPGGGGVVFWVSHLPAPGQVSDEASVEVGWRSRACVFLTLCFLSGTGWVRALLPLALEWTRVLPPSQQVGNRGGGRPTGTWGGPEGPRSLESRQRLGPGCLPFPGNRAPFLD